MPSYLRQGTDDHGPGPSQPKAIYDDADTHAERDRCLMVLGAYIDALDRGGLRGLTKRRLLVHIYRRVWGKRPLKAWQRSLEDTETHPERLRCLAVIGKCWRRVVDGELDHVSRRGLLVQVFERVEGG